MAFCFAQNERPEEGVRRIFREQIDGAIRAIDDPSVDREVGVHEARKHCKRIRALMRLVRPGMEEVYQRENAWFRDAAASLSDVRDADVMIGVARGLVDLYGDKKIPAEHGEAVLSELTARREQIVQARGDGDSHLEQFKALASDARRRADAFPADFGGIATVVAGMRKTYKRGRDSMKDAIAEGEAEAFHEWRKRAKYHRHHMELLLDLWPQTLDQRRKDAKQLADLLGEDHDLCVLRDTLRADTDAFGGGKGVRSFEKAIRKRLGKLRRDSISLGENLYDLKPKRLAKKVDRRWRKWIRVSPESAAASELAASGDATTRATV